MEKILSQKWEKAFVFFKHEGDAKGPEMAMRFRELADSRVKRRKFKIAITHSDEHISRYNINRRGQRVLPVKEMLRATGGVNEKDYSFYYLFGIDNALRECVSRICRHEGETIVAGVTITGRDIYRGGGSYHGSRALSRIAFSYRGSIWIGPGWGWGPGWGAPYYPYPYYSYPSYPYYPAPPVINQQQSPVYVEPAPQQEEQNYWYYCPNPQGYYPYVPECPKGWLKVIPSTVPPDEGE